MTVCKNCNDDFDTYGSKTLRLCRICLAAHQADRRINWFASRLRQHVIQSNWPDRERHQRTRVDARPEPLELVATEFVIEPEDLAT